MEYTFTAKLISEVRKLRYDSKANCNYELMSGGLLWTDEMTNDLLFQMLAVNNYSFRFVLAYRASVILEQENSEYVSYWNQWSVLFPDWPGFRKERCNPKLKSLLLEKRLATSIEIEQIINSPD
jgi:hypothetical protein